MAKLKRWGLYFKEKYGEENRRIVMKDFMDFYDDPEWDEIVVSGRCILGGEVSGREGFHDGDIITTSNIKTIERVGRGSINGKTCDFICATTASGSEYYFYSNEIEPYMYIMMDDIKYHGGAKTEREYYLPREFRGKGLL